MKLKVNKKLLRQIRDIISEKPKKFNMDWWHYSSYGEALDYNGRGRCGTAHCIAGWAQILTKSQKSHTEKLEFEDARDILGLNNIQAQALFCVESWPHEYEVRYVRASDFPLPQRNILRARIAVERINHFLATGE